MINMQYFDIKIGGLKFGDGIIISQICQRLALVLYGIILHTTVIHVHIYIYTDDALVYSVQSCIILQQTIITYAYN